MEEHSQHSGLRRGRDLSVACLGDWMWHLGIFDALDSYFPTGLMREEDIARAYAQLLLFGDRLQLRLAESERRVGEEAFWELSGSISHGSRQCNSCPGSRRI
jgi:hypothetical protein